MECLEQLNCKATLSLEEVARLLSASPECVHEAEVMLAEAIEHGELAANVKRWATEQWQGRQLPGNMNRRETYIDRTDLEAWLGRRGRTATG